MTLRTLEVEDKQGRKFLKGLPEGAPDSEAVRGVPLGPPSLAELGLPREIEVRLHNQLYARGILTERDARQRISEIQAALMAALRVDANLILAIYEGQGTSKEE